MNEKKLIEKAISEILLEYEIMSELEQKAFSMGEVYGYWQVLKEMESESNG